MNENLSSKHNGSRTCRRHGCRRAGLSLLEFLGCLIALVGGAWLGAIYAGIDVHHLAYVALSESDLIEKVPEQWRPVAPENAPGAPTPAELAQAVQGELVALREEITALRTDRDTRNATPMGAAAGDAAPSDASASLPFAKEASLAFWNRIGDVVRGELALQLDAESAATDGNATKVAALKGRICRFASSAIRAIPTDGVDPAATTLSKDVADWYERGGELYEQAVQIWESPARGQNTPTVAKEWEQAHQQHRNEGRLLHVRVAAVRDSLTRRFGDGFGEFEGL